MFIFHFKNVASFAYLHCILYDVSCQESFKERVEELRKTVQAAEKNREAAMRALAEERQRSLELQVKISRQVCVQFMNMSYIKI
jgi:uncharacterized membrane protein (DUF106 family)